MKPRGPIKLSEITAPSPRQKSTPASVPPDEPVKSNTTRAARIAAELNVGNKILNGESPAKAMAELNAGAPRPATTPHTATVKLVKAEEPMFTSKYSVAISPDLEVSIILSGKMLYYIPYRLELVGELKDSESDKNGNTRPEFELKSTKFGHVTLPSFLKKQGIELFKLMTSDKKIKTYVKQIKSIKVKSEDAIQVTVSR
jgi:hypothetical protein